MKGKQIDLNGVWTFKRTDQAEWQPAAVPGTALAALYKLGQLEDPFWRTNEDKLLELGRCEYEFCRSFIADDELLENERIMLVFEGLDTLADIALNGTLLGSTDNMHRTYEFDVTALLRSGRNELHVLFRSPVAYITERQANRRVWQVVEPFDGFAHLRKAHYMFGWDWAPIAPDCGIWRSVSLVGVTTARLREVYIAQRHEAGQVGLDMRIGLERASAGRTQAAWTVTGPDGTVIGSGQLRFDESAQEGKTSFDVAEPELWWPNGYGEQPLYTVEVQLHCERSRERLDARTLRIGLRTITVRREPDAWGETFELAVNGLSIFAKGATYVPEDGILEEVTRERTERLIRDCIEANFNAIRVRGCSFYPADWFYDLCDEYGLVVWQELMFDGAAYELTPDWARTVRREIEDNVRRIRHHASLGLWCGNNEIEWAWVDWSLPDDPKLREDYQELFERRIPAMLKELDPATFYWPSSPSSGGSFDKPNDESRGNGFCWHVWHGNGAITDYRKFYYRFCTEFGLQSLPSLATIDRFTAPGDRNLFSFVMERHQKSPQGNARLMRYLADSYMYPKNLESLIYTSQVLQAEAVQYAVEHWRRHRGRCMGAFYFQLNDRWPGISWAGIESSGSWKALHYAAKRFFAPVLLSACEEGTRVSLHITNDTRHSITGQIEWRLRNTRSQLLQEGTAAAEAGALSAAEAVTLDFAELLADEAKLRETYLQFALIVDGRTVSEGTVLFVKPKHLALVQPDIAAAVTESDEAFHVTLTSRALAKSVELALAGAEVRFGDNYFDLTAGEEREVKVLKTAIEAQVTLDDFQRRLRIRSLIDAF